MVAHRIPDKVFDEFFVRVAEGRSGSSVSKDDDMPAWSTVWRRFVKDQTMMDKYRTALESRGQVYADRLDELDDMLLKGSSRSQRIARCQTISSGGQHG